MYNMEVFYKVFVFFSVADIYKLCRCKMGDQGSGYIYVCQSRGINTDHYNRICTDG